MKNPSPKPRLTAAGCATLAAVLLTALAPASIRAQTYVHVYRLGENDPGAVAGGYASSSTMDAGTSPVSLTAGGTPQYTSNTPGPASTLALHFSGGQSLSGSFPSIANDNFGIEAWVRPADVTGDKLHIAEIGTAFTGMALFVTNGTTFGAYVAGLGSVDLNVLTANQWSHVGLVRNNGTLKAYVNGQESTYGPITTTYNLITSTATFSIGANTSLGALFQGDIDNVRIFTFETGAFNTSMFAYPASAIPEPSTYAGLAGLAALGLVALRRRRNYLRRRFD